MRQRHILLTIIAALSLPAGVPAAEAGTRQSREGMGTTGPAAVTLPAGQPSMRLESLAEGLAWYLSLDDHLTAVNAAAMERPADFTRTWNYRSPGTSHREFIVSKSETWPPARANGLRFPWSLVAVIVPPGAETIAQSHLVPNDE